MTLADACENAEGASVVLDRDIALAVYPRAKPVVGNDARVSVWDGNWWAQIRVKPFTASIDAAMTLVPPPCPIEGPWLPCLESGQVDHENIEWEATIAHNVYEEHRASAATPALALCAAALRARAASGEKTS